MPISQQLGQIVGQTVKNLPFSGGNLLQALIMTGAKNLTPTLPPEAIDSAKKSLKNFYTGAAQELLSTNPQGASILSQLIRQNEAMAAPAEPRIETIEQGSPKKKETGKTFPLKQGDLSNGFAPNIANIPQSQNITVTPEALNQAISSGINALPQGQFSQDALKLQEQALDILNSKQVTGLLSFFGIPTEESEDLKARKLANIATALGIIGEEPIQAGTREQLKIQKETELEKTVLQENIVASREERQRMNEFFKNTLEPKPLSGETATSVNTSQAVVNDISELQALLQANQKSLETLATPGNKLGQRVRDLMARLKANIISSRGGKALSKNEEKLFTAIIPRRGFGAKLQDLSSIIFQLDTLKEDASRQINLIQPSNEMKNIVQDYINRGYSREDIYLELKRRGKI